MQFKKARDFVHNLGLKTQKEWAEYSKSEKRPDILPSDPARIYKDNGWLNYGDWLGTGRIAEKYKKFKANRRYDIYFCKE